MSTSRTPSDVAFLHTDYGQLVAGRSLNALEPEEDEQLAAHLRVCAPCRLALPLLEEVAAELGRTTQTIIPSPALWRAVVRCAGAASFPAQPAPGSGTASRFFGSGGSV
jgi:hypothetical protein